MSLNISGDNNWDYVNALDMKTLKKERERKKYFWQQLSR